MRFSKTVDKLYLSSLSQQIQGLPSDEASSLLFEGAALVLFAGYPDIAYQLFVKLTHGNLGISEQSSLAHPIKSIIPGLCYELNIPSPVVFSQGDMSLSELEKYINKNLREYEHVSGIDKWFQMKMPLGNWSDDFIYDITHPKADFTETERLNTHGFLQDLHRVINVRCINRRKFVEASKFLKIFDDVVEAWNIDCKSWVEQEIIVFGIQTYLELNDIDNADRYIKKWWESLNNSFSALYLVGYLPDLMKRISAGVLQDYIQITQIQALEFLNSVNQRKKEPEIIGFIPTVEDWQNFLQKWDKAIFDNFDESHRKSYEGWFPEIVKRKSCLNRGATEEEINILEQKLQAKLPLSYKNFLLASNGFTILSEYCKLYGTDEIKWFVEENQEWAEIWDDKDERDNISDELYFQYGEHQDCIHVRGKYMKTALQISFTEDGYVYLLNPKIIDSRNEWEAWDFGTKLPGAYRYRSFWEMIQEVYQRCFDEM